MLFKGLKEKSIQRIIDKRNNLRRLLNGNSKIKTIGFLINVDDISITEKELTLISKSINAENKGVLNFTKFVKKTNESSDLISPKNIGWNISLKQSDLKFFCKSSFDILITLSLSDSLYLNAINTLSKAKFKVTTNYENQKTNDLVINTDAFNIDVFISELKKYLTILNKI